MITGRMALSDIQIRQAREQLDNCKKPLFFFDDDQDGLCSFLQLYRYKKEGQGFMVKTTPKINNEAGSVFAKKVREYSPDKLFILDIAVVEQDFLDEINVPVVWIDHHAPLKRSGVKYFNPRASSPEDNHPTSYLCYQIVNTEMSGRDMWIACAGCVADWFIPPFISQFRKDFPDLVESSYEAPGDILYNSRLGHLIRIFSFALKGKTADVMKCVNILTRIKSPYEILSQESSQGRFIYRRYEQMNKLYEPLIEEVLGVAHIADKTDEKLVLFVYEDDKSSFTSDLSNEVSYRYQNKAILIARGKNNEMKCSIRSAKAVLPPLIEKSLAGLDGYGGGHEHACGLNIKKEHFGEFVKRLRGII